MIKKMIFFLFAGAIILIAVSCRNKNEANPETGNVKETYESITMSDAKEVFMTPGEYVILDVRREDEFSSGHIPGAINIPNEVITEEAEKVLTVKNQVIYVYCRSGNRSKQAAKKLFDMGYTNIIEFGGILDWTGDIEK